MLGLFFAYCKAGCKARVVIILVLSFGDSAYLR